MYSNITNKPKKQLMTEYTLIELIEKYGEPLMFLKP